MNLAIVTPVLGALTETFIANHIKNLSVDSTFVITESIENQIIEEKKVLQIPLAFGPAIFTSENEAGVLSFLMSNKITHILCEYGCYGCEIIELNSRTLKLPIFIHFHGYDASQILRIPEMQQYYLSISKFVTEIIGVSNSMLNRLKNIGIEKSKLHLVPYGVQISDFRRNTTQNKTCNFLFIGRLVEKKAPLVLLKSFKKALELTKDIKLTIIGDGVLQEEIRQYISDNSLLNFVDYVGSKSHAEVWEYLKNADVYIQHSVISSNGDAEGIPNSILEAASFGLPIISTRHEGIKDFIIEDFSGILVDEYDFEEMANAIFHLSKDYRKRISFGENAKKIAAEHYENSRQLEKLRKLLINCDNEWVNTKISICIPTYNRAKYIAETIKSALFQQSNSYEIIVVDDGSTDNTKETVESFNSSKIRYIFKEHTNAPETRNLAVKEAKGEYILWLDSDDILELNVVETYLELIDKHKNIDVLYGDIDICDSTLNLKTKKTYSDWYNRNAELIALELTGNYIPNGGSLIKKDLFERVGNYNTSFRRAHDYEFWSRAVKTAKFKHCGETVLKWRWHDSNMSAESVKIDTSFEAQITKNMVKLYSLQELFPNYDWTNFANSHARAYLTITQRLILLKDFKGALEFAQKVYDISNDSSILQLIGNLEKTIAEV